MTRRRRAGALSLAAAVLYVSCSGTEGLSREELVRQANAACRRAAGAIAAIPPPDPGDPDAVADTAARVVREQRRELRRLRAIDADDAESDRLDRWLELVDRTLDESDRAVRALRRDDPPAAIAANARGAELDAEADAAARRLGFARCAGAADPVVP